MTRSSTNESNTEQQRVRVTVHADVLNDQHVTARLALAMKLTRRRREDHGASRSQRFIERRSGDARHHHDLASVDVLHSDRQHVLAASRHRVDLAPVQITSCDTHGTNCRVARPVPSKWFPGVGWRMLDRSHRHPGSDRRSGHHTIDTRIVGRVVDNATAIVVETVTIDCDNPGLVAELWRRLLDYDVVEHPTISIRLAPRDGSTPHLLFTPAGRESTKKNPLHFDLRPSDHAAAVAHALALGAQPVDIGQRGDESWTVLSDPEGNEFCILQSPADLLRRRAQNQQSP